MILLSEALLSKYEFGDCVVLPDRTSPINHVCHCLRETNASKLKSFCKKAYLVKKYNFKGTYK